MKLWTLTRRAAGIAALLAFGAAGMAGAKTLRVGMECTYAPFNYRTADGTLAGYDVDVAKGVAGILGDDLDFVCQQFDGLIPALLANKFDLIIASMSITEKRLQKIDFSIPYRDSVGQLIAKTDRHLKLFDESGQPIAKNFAGLRVGLERATTYANWFAAKLPDVQTVYYDSNDALYQDLRNGRVDVIMTNPMKGYLRFLSKAEGKDYSFVGPQIKDEKYFGTGVGIALRKGNDELKAQLDDAIEQLIKTGKLSEYAHKYFPFDIYNPDKNGS